MSTVATPPSLDCKGHTPTHRAEQPSCPMKSLARNSAHKAATGTY